MARVDNLITKGTSGAIGKEIVLRTFKQGTFRSKFPDMSRIIPSKNQTKGRERFARAVAYAKSVMRDTEKSAEYKDRQGYSVYHAALQDYLSWSDTGKQNVPSLPPKVENALKSLSLTRPEWIAIEFLNKHKRLGNRNYQEMNGVSKATASRHLHELVAKGVIVSNNGKGAGAFYTTGSPWEE
jgi:hypothetical protein